jgi:CDP-ribitol ribitolphosphotransferase
MNKLGLKSIKKIVLFRFLYPVVYKVCALRPVKKNKILFIEIHGTKLDGSFNMIISWLNHNKPNVQKKAVFLGWGRCRRMHYLLNCLHMIYELSDSSVVFITEACNVLGAVPKRKETKVIQLWHACGAFKKFGYSTAELKWGVGRKELEAYPNYKNMDMITVSSPEVIWAYEEAMGIETTKIYPIGVSRTDIFFKNKFKEKAQKKLKQLIPGVGARKVILYAPTFRGRLVEARSCEVFPWIDFVEKFGDEAVLLVKHHPFVKSPPRIPEVCRTCVFDVTDDLTIEELICVSDMCISDYSSLIFEYSLMEKPMIFFAPDIADYEDWRGFYYPYEEMTPGPVCEDSQTLFDAIENTLENFDVQKIREFREKFMRSCDGHATERIMKYVWTE